MCLSNQIQQESEINEQEQEHLDNETTMLDMEDEPAAEAPANEGQEVEGQEVEGQEVEGQEVEGQEVEGQEVEEADESVCQTTNSPEKTEPQTSDQELPDGEQADQELVIETENEPVDESMNEAPSEGAPENEDGTHENEERAHENEEAAHQNEEGAHEQVNETPAKGTPAARTTRLGGRIPQSAAPARIYELRSSTKTPLRTPGSAGTIRQRDRAATDPTQGRRQSLRLAAKTPSKVPLSESTPVRVDSSIIERAEGRRQSLRVASQTPSQERISTSKYFATPNASPLKPKSPRPPRGTVSALPFPTLSAPRFGLIQEELASDPFRLLIAITFLVRTPGRISVPVFYELMEKYPTPHALLVAGPDEIASMIKHLGLSVVRTAQIQKYARIWIKSPPSRETRYGVKNYPLPGDGSDVRAGEQLPAESEDPRASAWEIGHMTQGPYAIDSWRIFCRDVLLGRAEDWKGKGREPEFQPEWMRVMPADKELRAYLRWMWMQEGWDWDPNTGDKQPLSEELRDAVNEGRVQWDNTGSLQIVEVGDEIVVAG